MQNRSINSVKCLIPGWYCRNNGHIKSVVKIERIRNCRCNNHLKLLVVMVWSFTYQWHLSITFPSQPDKIYIYKVLCTSAIIEYQSNSAPLKL